MPMAYSQGCLANANTKPLVMASRGCSRPDIMSTASVINAAAMLAIKAFRAFASVANGNAMLELLVLHPSVRSRSRSSGYPGGCATPPTHASASSSPLSPPGISCRGELEYVSSASDAVQSHGRCQQDAASGSFMLIKCPQFDIQNRLRAQY